KAKQLMMVYLEYFLDERNENGSEPFATAAGLSIQSFLQVRDELFLCNKEYGLILSHELHMKQLDQYKSLVESRDPNPLEESSSTQFAHIDIKPSQQLGSIDSNKFKAHAIRLVKYIMPKINNFIFARVDTKDTINLPYATDILTYSKR
ncbi:MAG: hypothetical protein ABI597_07385, partial [Gammaproteobacteria bacterium]